MLHGPRPVARIFFVGGGARGIPQELGINVGMISHDKFRRPETFREAWGHSAPEKILDFEVLKTCHHVAILYHF